ncbi:hypothetical protein JHK84_048561 [Glycine max]|nr:hypothetical protein JHK85_049176 [Glycine max]KAG5103592.1 hypothetical protein JHK84_048561 [Glycine max]
MASKLLLITVFVFDLIAFGLAVAAEQRKSISSVVTDNEFWQVDASVAGSLLTLEAQGPVQLVFFIIAEVCLLAGSVENAYHTKEKVNISPFKSFITIQGEGADKTIVQWGDTAQSQPLGTYGSATFAVNSPYFIAKNITFRIPTD